MRLLLHDYGGYAFTLQLAEHLAGKGHQVTYLHGGLMQALQRSRRVSKQPNLRVESTENSQPFAKYSFLKRWMQEREYGARLEKRIAQIAPDIVVSANAPLDAQRKALHASDQIRARFVFWWQDVISLAMGDLLREKYGFAGGLIGAYYQTMERQLLRRSDRVLAISDDFLPIAQAWGIPRSKITILPNWAPLDELSEVPRNNGWARAHGLQGKFVFLYAGILGLKHDPQVFVSLSACFQDCPDVSIVVVSEGPGATWLTKRKQAGGLHNLQVLPFQPYEDLSAMLASAEVLLVTLKAPAAAYSVPSKVLSYLCAGRPVLLSAPPENPAAKAAKEFGFGNTAAPNDADRLCILARELYHSRDLRIRFGKNARTYAQSAFEIEPIAEQFLGLLE